MPIDTTKKAKVSRSTQQLRLTLTSQLESDLARARPKYPYLNDLEIVKLWIGKGANQDLNPTPRVVASKHKSDYGQMMQQVSQAFQLGEDWASEPDNIDYAKARPVNWSNLSS